MGFADAFFELKPEVVVLLGDRFELIAAAVSALMLKIPIAHIHGGERSEGSIDESVRHAITKMATVHFAATESYRRRIIQMGELPAKVFNFGAPGLDQLSACTLLTRTQLGKDLGISLDGPFALVTFHPATRDRESVATQARHILEAIELSGLRALFTMANADDGGLRINAILKARCELRPGRWGRLICRFRGRAAVCARWRRMPWWWRFRVHRCRHKTP